MEVYQMSGPGIWQGKVCTRQHGWALGELAAWEQREGSTWTYMRTMTQRRV